MRSRFLTTIACSVVALLLVHTDIFAQKKKGSDEPQGSTYVSATALITKFHTEDELKAMGKIELTKLYMERIVVLTEIIPYVALKTKPGATLTEMGIPETPLNLEHMQKEIKNKESYLAAVQNTLDDIVPYADKGNIIWAILYFEQMYKNINPPH
jgi:hypothetical protein